MDFEINAQGELTAYKGTGGDLRLPENVRVFSYDIDFGDTPKFGTLYLPKGFLGVRPEYSCFQEHFSFDPDNVDAGIKLLRGSCHGYLNEQAFEDAYAAGKLGALIGTSILPRVERFEVDPENIVYAAKDGVLYTKDFKTLLAIPSEYQGKVVLHDNTERIDRNAFRDIDNVTDIEFGSGMTKFSAYIDFGSYYDPCVRIYGPNIESMECYEEKVDIEECSSISNAALIFPKISITSRLYDKYYKILLAMGFCARPDCYDSEATKSYTKFVKTNRFEILVEARRIGAQDVIDYIDKLASQSTSKGKSTSDANKKAKVEKLSARNATLLLESKVCYGTDDDVAEVLKNYSDFAITARALGLACRYGSLRKVELLCKSASFDYKRTSAQTDAYFGTYRTNMFKVRYYADYSLMVVLDHFREEYCGKWKLLAVNRDLEIEGAKLLPQKERAEIIKLLLEKRRLNHFDLNRLYYYSLLFANFELATILKSYGASLYDFKDEIEGNTFYSLSEFDYLVYHEHPEAVFEIARHAKAEGITLTAGSTTSYEHYQADPKLFARFVNEIKIKDYVLSQITRVVIRDKLCENLSAILATGNLEPFEINEFIEMSKKWESPECTALLRDYKKSLPKAAAKPRRKR